MEEMCSFEECRDMVNSLTCEGCLLLELPERRARWFRRSCTSAGLSAYSEL